MIYTIKPKIKNLLNLKLILTDANTIQNLYIEPNKSPKLILTENNLYFHAEDKEEKLLLLDKEIKQLQEIKNAKLKNIHEKILFKLNLTSHKELLSIVKKYDKYAETDHLCLINYLIYKIQDNKLHIDFWLHPYYYLFDANNNVLYKNIVNNTGNYLLYNFKAKNLNDALFVYNIYTDNKINLDYAISNIKQFFEHLFKMHKLLLILQQMHIIITNDDTLCMNLILSYDFKIDNIKILLHEILYLYLQYNIIKRNLKIIKCNLIEDYNNMPVIIIL